MDHPSRRPPTFGIADRADCLLHCVDHLAGCFESHYGLVLVFGFKDDHAPIGRNAPGVTTTLDRWLNVGTEADRHYKVFSPGVSADRPRQSARFQALVPEVERDARRSPPIHAEQKRARAGSFASSRRRRRSTTPSFSSWPNRCASPSSPAAGAGAGRRRLRKTSTTPDIPAGYTYLGQFVDHDITFDPASSLQQDNDPDALTDFRSPRFDLDSVYGSGPDDEPFQYDQTQPGKLLVGDSHEQIDLPRNAQGIALLGDPRNDENIIVSQLQTVFLRLHNKLVDEVAGDQTIPPERRFAEAQQRTRWHYQWVVVNDFLRRLVGSELLEQLFAIDQTSGEPEFHLAYFRWHKNVFMPVEFSVAAYRFGHSQVRPVYDLNATVTNRPIFLPGDQEGEFDDLRGFRPLPQQWAIDWKMFLPIEGSSPQLSRRIDARLTGGLFDLPGLAADQPQTAPPPCAVAGCAWI